MYLPPPLSLSLLLGQEGQEGGPDNAPRELLPLPWPHHLTEVWCGSDFTVVADQYGGVWGCGDILDCNFTSHEDSTITWETSTNATNESSSGGWRRALRVEMVNNTQTLIPVSLSVLWEGALSCGSNHVIALVDHNPSSLKP
mmetsp:Transcript_3185/g.4822  ORF Transcript_3185/g.4822 Transcript_3185/m.4822 type:complete len:142 (-) Transcript_3185:91-516(-)